MKKQFISLAAAVAGALAVGGCATDSRPVQGPLTMWTSSQVADPNSVEGKLRAEGKSWAKIAGEIRPGLYVQDVLEPRLNQPQGRGAIGQVISVRRIRDGSMDARVDFGNGYRVGIHEYELALVKIN